MPQFSRASYEAITDQVMANPLSVAGSFEPDASCGDFIAKIDKQFDGDLAGKTIVVRCQAMATEPETARFFIRIAGSGSSPSV